MKENSVFDSIVIGGGPAGAQCTLWMTKLGLNCCLIEQDKIGGLQNRSPYTNSWLSAVQATTRAQDVARNIAANLKDQGCEILFDRCNSVTVDPDSGDFLVAAEQQNFRTRTCVIATGTREVTGGFMRSDTTRIGLVDVASGHYQGKRVAILGGGDAACEAHATVTEMGASETGVFARTVRARPQLWAEIPQTQRFATNYTVTDGKVRPTNAPEFEFDVLVVCYGWQPVVPANITAKQDALGHFITDEHMETSVRNLFAIGDVNTGPVPCVATALADGVYAAKAIEKRLSGKVS